MRHIAFNVCLSVEYTGKIPANAESRENPYSPYHRLRNVPSHKGIPSLIFFCAAARNRRRRVLSYSNALIKTICRDVKVYLTEQKEHFSALSAYWRYFYAGAWAEQRVKIDVSGGKHECRDSNGRGNIRLPLAGKALTVNVTSGYSDNGCAFCAMSRGEPFRAMPLDGALPA